MPTPREDAFAFVDATAAQPRHLCTGPGPRHIPLLRTLCEEADAKGNLVPVAMLAAITAEHGCEVATLDRDFARFLSVPHLVLR